MLAQIGLDPQEALVCTMVLVAATDGGITDREIGVMSGLVQTLPAFACEIIAGDGFAAQPTLQMLEFVLGELQIDPLVSAAIERAARARYRKVED